jgi:hAT family C-terminal dimerisation region
MAQDYLAIHGSATPSERAFSSGGLTGTKYRNRLNGMVFESLQLLKSAYRNGHISAASDAKQHIDALIAALDEEEVDDEDLPELIDA